MLWKVMDDNIKNGTYGNEIDGTTIIPVIM